jgi:hypothetical protein
LTGMYRINRLIFIELLTLLIVISALSPLPAAPLPGAAGKEQDTGKAPRVFLLDPLELSAVKKEIRTGSQRFAPALKRLMKDADAALYAGPFSIVNKSITPPGGDRHDYTSLAPYWWPNPATKDHLPYIRRDGERNPEGEEIGDHKNLSAFISTVNTLALAAYFSDNSLYARRAELLLSQWFLDQKTLMNPNVDYGQFIPGAAKGRAAGIIDTRRLPEVIDAVGLLQSVKELPSPDRKGLESWFGRYLDWLLKSDLGSKERNAKNNHGVWYDAQVAPIALFLGRDEAGHALREGIKKRIAAQIEPDGSQPLELARTNSFSYSLFNLEAFFRLAACGDRLGLNLWDYRTEDGRGIHRALEWLLPFAAGERQWPYRQIIPSGKEQIFTLLRQAAIKYKSSSYGRLAEKIAPDPSQENRVNLLFPSSAHQNF